MSATPPSIAPNASTGPLSRQAPAAGAGPSPKPEPAPTPTPAPTQRLAGDGSQVVARMDAPATQGVDIEGIELEISLSKVKDTAVAAAAGTSIVQTTTEFSELQAKSGQAIAKGRVADAQVAKDYAKGNVDRLKGELKTAAPAEKGNVASQLALEKEYHKGASKTLRGAEKELKQANRAVAKAEVQTAANAASTAGKSIRWSGVGAGGLAGSLQIADNAGKVFDESLSGKQRLSAGLNSASGVADVAGATANGARLVTATSSGVGQVARWAGPVGMGLGGAANVVDGGSKFVEAFNKTDAEDPERGRKMAQGGLKALGGAMMTGGAIATASVVAAPAGAVVMVAGAAITAGVSVWEWFTKD